MNTSRQSIIDLTKAMREFGNELLVYRDLHCERGANRSYLLTAYAADFYLTSRLLRLDPEAQTRQAQWMLRDRQAYLAALKKGFDA